MAAGSTAKARSSPEESWPDMAGGRIFWKRKTPKYSYWKLNWKKDEARTWREKPDFSAESYRLAESYSFTKLNGALKKKRKPACNWHEKVSWKKVSTYFSVANWSAGWRWWRRRSWLWCLGRHSNLNTQLMACGLCQQAGRKRRRMASMVKAWHLSAGRENDMKWTVIYVESEDWSENGWQSAEGVDNGGIGVSASESWAGWQSERVGGAAAASALRLAES